MAKIEIKGIETYIESAEALTSTLESVILLSEDNDEIREQLDGLMEMFEVMDGGRAVLKKALKKAELLQQNYIVENKLLPRFTFTKEDFLNSEEPYAYVFAFAGNKFEHQQELNKMAEEAKKAGFSGFKKQYNEYGKEMRLTMKASESKLHPSDFPNQPLELETGTWICDADGVRLEDFQYGTQIACCHPIMPVERLVNIDTQEEKIKLAFCKSKRWRNITVGKDIIAVSGKIPQLASLGIAVTSENAKALVKFLCDIENMNLDTIPEYESVGRLGYVDEGRFSPYVDGLIFDGDAAYKAIFEAISNPKGNLEEWVKVVKKCRSESLVARIIISASFASILVKLVGGLPFFVHLWSCESGTGKTVALMVAASVWGNPEPGTYIQSFNSTSVGHEKMAAFLNNIPMCIDELQLAKDHHGNSKFDVYQLAQGVGRTRGNKAGGVDKTPTWSNCILTTGETPIVKDGAGAGAVNRVIDLECPIGHKVVLDGQGTANAVKMNYGLAGREYLKNLDIEKAKSLYDMYFETLSKGETTEKQSMAAALVLAADGIVSEMFFDEESMGVDQMQQFLKSKAAVSVGDRGYQFICDWVAMNIRNFISNTDLTDMPQKIYGIKDGTDWIYINQSIFRSAVEEGGFDSRALLSYLKSKGLIQYRGRRFTKGKRIAGVNTECVVLHLPDVALEADEETEMI